MKSSFKFEEKHFVQRNDHLNAFSVNHTFTQRYLLDKTHWDGAAAKGPMFFMTGAEGGDIELVASVYGHIHEMAKNLGAMVVFMEGRYFGKSRPFGDDESYKPQADRIGLLTIEQMLLDYVMIISAIRNEYDPSWGCPTLAFGGSLAGSLAAMMRLKYANVVDMSFASSAPLWGYPLDGYDRFSWRKQITENWKALSKTANCDITPLVQKAFVVLQSNQTPQAVQKAFNTCEKPYAGNAEDIQTALWQLLEGEGEFVYPSENSPIPEICHRVHAADTNPNQTDLDMAASFFDLRGTCLNLTREMELTPDNLGWEFLSCTEVVNPIGCNNETDFFPPYYWSIADVSQFCQSRWNVTPIDQGFWVRETFGFENRRGQLSLPTSRVLFSYGELDPWHFFAVGARSLSPTLPVIHIRGGAHCSDMMGRQDGDTPEMQAARQYEQQTIKTWVDMVRGTPAMLRNESRAAALLQINSQAAREASSRGGVRARVRKAKRHHLAIHHD